MAEFPESKRPRTDVQAVEPTCILHPLDCRQSPQDLERMRDMIKKDPSVLYKVQPIFRRPKEFYDPNCNISFSEIQGPPLWHACEVDHLACVKLILETSGPDNVKLLDNFLYDTTFSDDVNIVFYNVARNSEEVKKIDILKAILEHGLPPNVEMTMVELIECHTNSDVLKILKQYKTKRVIFPSPALNSAIRRGLSEIVKLLFEYGAYPDPVILTESGSILPLYPTLGQHMNPIPHLCHPVIDCPDILDSLFEQLFSCERNWPEKNFVKTLLVHGAMIPHYAKRDIFSVKQELFGFDVITKIFGREIRLLKKYRFTNFDWGRVESDGRFCRYHDIILELLMLYHQFGGNLWWKMSLLNKPCEGGKGECVEWLRDPINVRPCKTIIDWLEQLIPEPEAQSLVVGEVRRMMSIPPSLQHSARLVIRRSMGYGCVRNLEALPLPGQLKKYLMFVKE